MQDFAGTLHVLFLYCMNMIGHPEEMKHDCVKQYIPFHTLSFPLINPLLITESKTWYDLFTICTHDKLCTFIRDLWVSLGHLERGILIAYLNNESDISVFVFWTSRSGAI